MSWKEEYWKSIKSFDTEEKLDLFFYRPLGFLIAKACLNSPITPTALTIVGLLLGLVSGFFFYHNETNQSLAAASILFILAGVFDSSDGQLARMGGKSTKLGLILDGICDNFVFASAYLGSVLTLIPIWGWKIWPVAVFAGFCHSLQSSMLDFYNREYLYFGAGKAKADYWNETIEEAELEKSKARGIEKLLVGSRFSWVWQQNKLTTRNSKMRLAWKNIVNSNRCEEFQAIYRDHNRSFLRLWRLMGANFHTIMIIIFVFLRRFDLYLILVDIILLNICLILLSFAQKRIDQRFVRKLLEKGILIGNC
jgi:phosphatidylglycerophosphate synthase